MVTDKITKFPFNSIVRSCRCLFLVSIAKTYVSGCRNSALAIKKTTSELSMLGVGRKTKRFSKFRPTLLSLSCADLGRSRSSIQLCPLHFLQLRSSDVVSTQFHALHIIQLYRRVFVLLLRGESIPKRVLNDLNRFLCNWRALYFPSFPP